MDTLNTLAKVNGSYPVIPVIALPHIAKLSTKQLGLFIDMCSNWSVNTGLVLIPLIDDVATTKASITAIMKTDIIKKVSMDDEFITVIIHPAILCPDNYTEVLAKWDALRT